MNLLRYLVLHVRIALLTAKARRLERRLRSILRTTP